MTSTTGEEQQQQLVILKDGSGPQGIFNGSRARIKNTEGEQDRVQVELEIQPFQSNRSIILDWKWKQYECHYQYDQHHQNHLTLQSLPDDVFILILGYIYEENFTTNTTAIQSSAAATQSSEVIVQQDSPLLNEEEMSVSSSATMEQQEQQDIFEENVVPQQDFVQEEEELGHDDDAMESTSTIATTKKQEYQISLHNAANLLRTLSTISKDFHQRCIRYLQCNAIHVDFRQYYVYRTHWVVPTMLWLAKNECKLGKLHTAIGGRLTKYGDISFETRNTQNKMPVTRNTVREDDVGILLYFLQKCDTSSLSSIYLSMHFQISIVRAALNSGVLPDTVLLKDDNDDDIISPTRQRGYGLNEQNFHSMLRHVIQQEPLQAEIVVKNFA